MSCAARALGSLKIADSAVSASYEGVFDAEREKQITERAVAQVVRRISPIRLVSRTDSAALPTRHYISLDLEDFQ
jgi:hypothetical protein